MSAWLHGLEMKTRQSRLRRVAHPRREPAGSQRRAMLEERSPRRRPRNSVRAPGRVGAGHLLKRLVALALGGFELGFEAVGGGAQVVAALARRLGEGRIGEMPRILDPGAGLFGRDLAVEIGGHTLELMDHMLKVGDLARLFVRLKALQPQRQFPCLHGSIPRNHLHSLGLQTRSVPTVHGHPSRPTARSARARRQPALRPVSPFAPNLTCGH